MYTEVMKTEQRDNVCCATLHLPFYRFMLAQRLAEPSSRGIHSLPFLLPQPLYFPKPNFKTRRRILPW